MWAPLAYFRKLFFPASFGAQTLASFCDLCTTTHTRRRARTRALPHQPMPKYVLEAVPFRLAAQQYPAPAKPPPGPPSAEDRPWFKLQATLAEVAVRNNAMHARCVHRLLMLQDAHLALPDSPFPTALTRSTSAPSLARGSCTP